MDRRHPPGISGRVPLAVIVVDAAGTVSHWSTGARRLFGPTRQEAVGRPAVELLPVVGALEAASPPDGGHDAGPAAGRARLFDTVDREDGGDPLDVLWWAYPLAGPGTERLLVLAADAARVGRDAEPADGLERLAPGFALHTEFEASERLAKRLPEILPSMNPLDSARIVAQVLELGYPVLEIGRHDRVPVTPDWGVPRRAERQARRRAARAAAPADPAAVPAEDLSADLAPDVANHRRASGAARR